MRRHLRERAPLGVAAAFGLSGLVHLVRPSVFTPIVPGYLPAPTGLLLLSGLAELACATGLVQRRTWAGPASAALLLAVWPANIEMARQATADGGISLWAVGLWLRVPLQLPLIWAALQRPRTSPLAS